jgi:cytochrome bd-type quinol oxidase subunit 2
MPDIINTRSTVDWASILAGAVLATAVGLILSTFGIGIGLSMNSPYEGEGMTPSMFAFLAGLWILAIQVISFWMGGYVAGRLRSRQSEGTEHETDVRDSLHGLLAWGVGVIAAAVISFAAFGGGTAAANSDNSGLAASIARATGQEVDRAAAVEPARNANASDETIDERRTEVARKLTLLSAFITAASLLVGAAAAFFAAGVGGHHRDRNIQLKLFVLRRPNVQPTSPTV